MRVNVDLCCKRDTDTVSVSIVLLLKGTLDIVRYLLWCETASNRICLMLSSVQVNTMAIIISSLVYRATFCSMYR